MRADLFSNNNKNTKAMENTNNNQERCRVIRDPKELNSEGCRFFMEADTIQPTLISSTMLRWLTHENDGINYYTKEQEEAVKRIIAAQRREDMAPPFSMQILLYSDPRRLGEYESRYIKALLQCVGVEVWYLRTMEEQRLRIASKGNKLFLSMSGNQINEVHEGILYESTNENSPLLNYFNALFTRDLNRAKQLKLKNNRIVFADNWFKRVLKWCKTEKAIGIIIGVVGIFVTVLVAFFVPWTR